MKKILITDLLNEDALKLLEKTEDISYTDLNTQNKDEILKVISDYDALIVRSKTQVDADIINAGTNLKVIGRAGVGVDNIDLEAAEKKGILVVNAPEESLDSVADLTMTLILTISRKIIDANLRTKSGNFNRKGLVGRELSKKTMGVLGLGRIGTKVALRASAFGMKVVAYDPYISNKDINESIIKLVDFNTVLRQSDVITIHTPLTDETKGLISKKEIAKMKDGSILVNTSRGAIVDTKALVEALDSKKILGAGLDVVEDETKDNPLLKYDNVILTPHLGASTKEAQKNVGIEIVKEVCRVLFEKTPKNPVNFPTLSRQIEAECMPCRDLIINMGLILSSICEGSVDKINIKYPNNLPTTGLNILTRYFLSNFLKRSLSGRINVVNAIKLAQQRNIEIVESISQKKDIKNLLEIEIMKNSKKITSILGVIDSSLEQKILAIDVFEFQFNPKGYVTLVSILDKPGLIGKVTVFLGNESINIAELQASRNTKENREMMLIKTDQKVSESQLKRLKKIEGVYNAWTMSL